MSGFRLRICFQKTGRLRYLSHLEVGRACERGARRAGLPYAVSQGFNPRMRMAFGPALPVGTAGLHEYLDVQLSEYVPAGRALEALRASMVDGLSPLRAGYVAGSEPSLSAALTIAKYEVDVDTDIGAQVLEEALEAVRETGELATERKGRTKVYDLTEALPKEPEVSSRKDGTVVEMTTRIGPAGSLRPELFITAALQTADARASSLLVTRTELLVEEGSTWLRPLD